MRLTRCVALALALGLPCSVAAQGLAEARALYSRTLAAIERGEGPETDPPGLRDYVLRPYLEAARIRRLVALDRPEADARWQAFRAAHPGHVENRDLEREWWRSLGRRQQWVRLWAELPEWPPLDDLRCLRLRAGIELNQPRPALIEGIQRVWLTGSSLPEACTRPFQWLHEVGARPPALVAQRLDLALAANELAVARYLLRVLPEPQRAPYELRLALRSEPARALPRLVEQDPSQLPEEDLFVGWRAWIRDDATAAARLAPRLAALRGLGPEARARVWNELGLRLSWRREADALDHFRRAGRADDELTQQWRLRAALWSGDWQQADAWLETLTPELADHPRWQYWRARVRERRHGRDAAASDYRRVLDANNVYALLAAWRLGERLTPRPRPGAAPDPAAQQAWLRNPAIWRMQELHALHDSARFNLEWFALLPRDDRPAADQLSHLAFAQGWWLHGVAAATRAGIFDDFQRLYPRPYDAVVLEAAQETGLPPSLLYALIRQESLYNPRAASRANAFGLMQLLIPTARGVAQRYGLPVPDREALFLPARNVPLGSRYLRERVERYDGQWLPAIAAYNAGAGAVDRWLPAQPMDPDIWMENIPFNETRDYVGKLLWHQAVFAWLQTGEPLRPDVLLHPVQRRAP